MIEPKRQEISDPQTFLLSDTQTSWSRGLQINELLKLMVDKGASDLHVTVPGHPVLRIGGELVEQEGLPPVTPKDSAAIFEQITSEEQRDVFRKEL